MRKRKIFCRRDGLTESLNGAKHKRAHATREWRGWNLHINSGKWNAKRFVDLSLKQGCVNVGVNGDALGGRGRLPDIPNLNFAHARSPRTTDDCLLMKIFIGFDPHFALAQPPRT